MTFIVAENAGEARKRIRAKAVSKEGIPRPGVLMPP
jgi:hypothetical protein